MGTRGYIVYSRKGRFFYRYNHCDSYPRGLGYQVVSSVPREREAYQTWLERLRQEYDPADAGKDIAHRRPLPDIMIEYVYEIDLDTETFWINGYPMFRLDHMPPTEDFVDFLTKDHYGRFTTKPEMPVEYRYLPVSLPPCSDSALNIYCSSITPQLPHSGVAVHDLLGIDEELSQSDRLRLRVLEVIVGHLMSSDSFASPIFASQVECEPSTSLSFTKEAAVKLVLLALHPFLFSKDIKASIDSNYQKFKTDSNNFWIKPNVCIKASVNLDDETTLKASIGDLVECIHGLSKDGAAFGVLCSVFHCVLVKVDMTAGGTFIHTPALDFIPSRYPRTPSTPGLTAVLRLASKFDHTLFNDLISDSNLAEPFHPHADVSTHFAKLPEEMVKHIASFLSSPIDLLSFGLLSEAVKAAVTPFLAIPSFNDCRLLSISNVPTDGLDEVAPARDKVNRSRLYAETFVTLDAVGDIRNFELNPRRPYGQCPRVYLFKIQRIKFRLGHPFDDDEDDELEDDNDVDLEFENEDVGDETGSISV